MRQTKVLIPLLLIALAAPAIAQKGAPPLTVEDEKAYLDAQIELLRKRGELIAQQRAVAGNSMMNLPQVASISKVGPKYVALLQYSNGTTEYVQENELLRQGVLIAAITRKQVIVSVVVGKKTVPMPLDFVAVATQTPSPSTNGQNSIPPELLPAAPSIVLPATPPVLGEAHKAPVSAPAAPGAAAPAPAQAAPAVKGK